MDGLTVKAAQNFLETGRMQIGGTSQSESKTSGASQNPAANGVSFAQTLENAVHSVNDLQKNANRAMENLAAGKTDNIADVMIATEKADIALKLMVQVRNKMIDAYQEVMRMQV